MKRIALVTFFTLIAAVSFSQEQAAKKYELGANIGMTTFTNYPALSLFQDAADCYANWSGAVHFGFRKKNMLYGLHTHMSYFNTSAIELDEWSSQTTWALMARRYDRIGENFETVFGLKIGLSVMSNSFSYIGKDYNRTRVGTYGEVETGVNYVLESGNYFGIRFAIDMGLNRSKDVSLPVGLVGNDKRFFGGYILSIQYGLRF